MIVLRQKAWSALLGVLMICGGSFDASLNAVDLKGLDIGGPAEEGSTRAVGEDGFEIVAGGADIWASADQFHFAYESVSGDFDKAVRVVSLDFKNNWSKAGLMVREDLTPQSKNLNVVVTPSEGADMYESNVRMAQGGATGQWTGGGRSPSPDYPHAWVRIKRQGNQFTSYRADSEGDWTQIAQMSLSFPTSVFFGLAVTSHDNGPGNAAKAVFRQYGDVEGTSPPDPSVDETDPVTEPVTPTLPTADRGLLREVYLGIPGTQVSDLTNHPKFPEDPDEVGIIDEFEVPINVFDQYGQRVRGYVTPQQTGDYIFWVSGDDYSSLFLSTDDLPVNKREIATVPGWTATRQWNKYPQQESKPIRLEAGQVYYIEALMKEQGGGDNLAVRWKLPSGEVEEPIGSQHLLPWGTSFEPPRIAQPPANFQARENGEATFSVTLATLGPVTFEWFVDDMAVADSNAATLTLQHVPLSDDGAKVRVLVSNSQGEILSQEAVLSVSPETTPPRLISAANLDQSQIAVSFSEPISAVSGERLANYSLSGGLTLLNAAVSPDGLSVVLTTSPLTVGTTYVITVSGIEDRAASPNLIVAGSSIELTAVELIPVAIGGASIEGDSEALESGGVRLTGAGFGVAGRSDQGFFTYQQRVGDFDIRVRVGDLQNVDARAQAGIMARQSADGGSVFAAALASPSFVGSQFFARSTQGGNVSEQGHFPSTYPSAWLRLKRSGNRFTGFASSDGRYWQELGSTSGTFPSAMLVGLSLASNDDRETVSADFHEFSDVSQPQAFAGRFRREPLGGSSRRTGLTISEIMYNPVGGENGSAGTAFVEIYNSQEVFEEIGGYRLSGDVDYQFPEGTLLEGGAFVVVAANPEAIKAERPLVQVHGPFEGELSRAKGTVRLRNRIGALLLETIYQDSAPWPVAADGTGHSLVLAKPSYGEGDPRAWEASSYMGGSPGAIDAEAVGAVDEVVINELLAHTDEPSVDYIELFNAGERVADLSGLFLSDRRRELRFEIPDGVLLAPGAYVVFDQNQLGFNLDSGGDSVYLVDANRSRVIDALRFEGQENGVSQGRSPNGSGSFVDLQSSTPGAANDDPLIRDIVINEIMYNPISGNDDEEYVELYNRGEMPVDLSHWRLVDGIQFTFPQGTVLGVEDYLVVARNAAHLRPRYENLNESNTLGDYQGRLSNSGERVRLVKPDDPALPNETLVIVDEVTYKDGGQWGKWADRGGSSLELVDPASDNRFASNWADSDESDKSEWVRFEHTGRLDHGQGTANEVHVMILGAGEALIDGIQVSPAGGNNRLANGTFESGVGGWVRGGNHVQSRQETSEGFQSARSMRLIATGGGDNGANRIEHDLSGSALSPNSTATLRGQARWLTGHTNLLVRLKGNYLEAVVDLPVPTNLGTPARINTARVVNAGPAIVNVSHEPVLPRSGQAVLVQAQVVDPDRVDRLVLSYRRDPNRTRTTVTMNDAGVNGDRVAGDGVFSGRIPAQSTGVLVGFYLDAFDGAVQTAASRFPQNGESREALVRWGEELPEGSFMAYRMWHTAGTIETWSRRENLSNEALDGTFVYGDFRAIYNMEARYRGSPFIRPRYNTPTGALAAFVLDMPADNQLLGATEFNLDWLEQPGRDNTFQREKMSFWIGDQLDVPFTHQKYVFLYVNGRQRGEIYIDSQHPSSEYVSGWFDKKSEGELFKIDDWFEFNDEVAREFNQNAQLRNYTTTGGEKKLARYRWSWEKKFNGGLTDDHSNLFALVDAMNTGSAGSSAYHEAVDALVDVEQWARVFATRRIVADWDGYSYSRGKNQFMYLPNGGKWQMLLWDLDFSLGGGSREASEGLFSGVNDSVISKFYNHPAFRRAYLRAMSDALDSVLTDGKMHPVMDANYAALQANGVNAANPNAIKTWVRQRRSTMQTAVNQANAAFQITTSNGADFSSANNLVRLEGTAPVSVRTITVNGIAYPVEWTSVNRWRVSLALEPGANDLSLAGLGSTGQALEGVRDEITIRFTGEAELPEENLIFTEIMYHAAAPGGEFVEIHNRASSTSFDLTGYQIEGIGFDFEEATVIGPGEYLVVVRDRDAFSETYGSSIRIAGEYAGLLDNGGEKLRLVRNERDGSETVVGETFYDDESPWPVSADGMGPSLQLIDSEEPDNRIGNWGTVEGTFEVPEAQTLLEYDSQWRFNQTGEVPSNWMAMDFGDASWAQGRGLLFVENSGLPAAKSTPLELGQLAYYFRHEFESANAGGGGVTLNLSLIVDDGAVVYLNGSEVLRIGVPAGTVTPATLANRTVGNAAIEGPFTIPSNLLRKGRNVLAVEVHQTNATSSDIVFGAALVSDVEVVGPFSPGAASSLAADLAPFADLWINEVFLTEGVAWVELVNEGSVSIDLSGHHLSFDSTHLADWRFPEGTTLESGQYWVVDSTGQEGQLTLPAQALGTQTFRGEVVLSRSENQGLTVLDLIRFEGLNAPNSVGRDPGAASDDALRFFVSPTKGAQNSLEAPGVDVVINEWMASNTATLADPTDGRFEDWFELYNRGEALADLTGYSITDDPSNPRKFVFPSGVTLGAGHFLLVWADGDVEVNADRPAGELHVNFGLSRSGESIALYDPEGSLVNRIDFGEQAADVSQGLAMDGVGDDPVVLSVATPGRPNAGGEGPVDPGDGSGGTSHLVIAVESLGFDANDRFVMSFVSVAGSVYELQFKDALSEAEWTPLGEVTAVEERTQVIDNDPFVPYRFYRVVKVSN